MTHRCPLFRRAALIAFFLVVALGGIVPAHAIAVGPVGNLALLNPNQIDPDDDAFGVAMTRGDFNADGIDDIVVADRQHPNLVRVFFGTTWTIGEPVTFPFTMETVPVPMLPGASLGPNIALASGDFTRDITDDDELVVGVPGDSFSQDNAGAVFVLDRTMEGGWEVANTIRQGFGGFIGVSEVDDHFGAALAVGHFDQNDLVDLAIGIPGETTSGAADSGVVYIVYQGVGGLMNDNEEAFYRGFNGLTGAPNADEQLGYALAAGDFNADGVDDLAVGIPGASCAGQINSGSVMVLLGRDDLDGLDAAGVSYWSQAMAGVVDDCEPGDRFGAALVAGQFRPTPIGEEPSWDLAVGVPGESVDAVNLAGAVAILYGSEEGMTSANNLLIHEGSMPGGSLQPAAFGTRLASGRVNAGAGTLDSLVVGSPLAAENGLTFAGRTWLIPSSGGRLSLPHAGKLSLTPAYQLGPGAALDAFGSQIVIGDFNDDGDNDIAIGAPGHDITGDGSGAVQVIYQSVYIFVDGFED